MLVTPPPPPHATQSLRRKDPPKEFNLDMQSEDDITDRDEHGTLCTGIAAGCPYNDAYMTNPDDTSKYTYLQRFPGGIAPKAKLILCRNDFSKDQVLKALEHLISIQRDNCIKVDVICMSFGLDKHHDDIEDKPWTLRRCGTICVASAGNDGKTRLNAVTFRGTCGDVICVGANDSHGFQANFSPVGQEQKCLAPGVDIAGPVTHTKDCLDKVFTKKCLQVDILVVTLHNVPPHSVTVHPQTMKLCNVLVEPHMQLLL